MPPSSTAPSAPVLQITALLVLIAGALLLLAGILFSGTLTMNLDGAMYLEGAMTLLDGGLLYVDFVDINPPLIGYASTAFERYASERRDAASDPDTAVE